MGMATIATGRRFWLVFTLLVICTEMTFGAPGGGPELTYRTNVTEVSIRFSAMDQNQHGVATLQAGDFAVVDKDVIVRNFQSFTRSDWTRLEIAILADTSESVTPHLREEIGQILELVSRTTGVPDENLSMFSFRGVQPALLCAGNCRASHAADQLVTARAGGLTPLFDTVVFASDYLSQHGDAHAQKILIVFSDGEDTISRHSLADAIDAATAGDVQIYCIGLRSSAAASASPAPQGNAALHRLAEATGGRNFSIADGAASAADAILEDFRASYTVTYRLPTHAAGFHVVRIRPTHNLNLQFHNRSGYYYPSRAQ
jgi:VWFA-related protein